MKGQDIYNLGIKHIGESYILGSVAPKDDPTYKGPFDCAEFASYLVYQVTQRLYGCANNSGKPHTQDAYTGFWARDAEQLGTKILIDVAIATPGAFLLRVAANGTIGHIACSDGKGGTIEANSKRYGVNKFKAIGRRWDHGVLIPWVEYSVDQPTEYIGTGTIVYRFTKPMMRGRTVQLIQKAVNVLGGFKVVEDGFFGIQTFNAVKSFQYHVGLVPDGEVGNKTFAALGIKQIPS